ncbi:SDR family NAD(P)-dependent oxidoreductase [Microlunatus sp. Gsoil 973]|uniref:SDR family NAD(P)-dependent oxidoreductase n=1 Tax=Microlunatus sp. Gsoil 973 TaxID=2672569 RepID=UPI0018A85DB6|nr:SDR family oxidoreductase [Microlunatus sp. Gsoil 973]
MVAVIRPFLQSQVALITGAGRGIGAATAELLARAGAQVVAVARSKHELDQLGRRINQELAGRPAAVRGGILADSADVADRRDVQEVVSRTRNRYGGIDLLINVAGIVDPLGRPLWEVTESEWASCLATNLAGPFHTMATVIPAMLDDGGGRIISVSSRAAIIPVTNAAPYSAAKAGLDHLTRTVAAELDGTGVTAVTVDPGPTDTPTFDRVIDNLFPDAPAFAVDRRRRPVEDAAVLLAWLCSPATAGLTGVHITWNDPRVARRVAGFEQWLTVWGGGVPTRPAGRIRGGRYG